VPTETTRIRAAVCHRFGEPLRVEQVELRRPSAGEVGVRLAACAICHSDVASIEGAWDGELPAVYGHEAAGVVEEVGSGVDGVQEGDRVVVTLVRFCGRCRTCLRGLPALCERLWELPISRDSPLRTTTGTPIQQGIRTAAFAEKVTVHASQVVPVPHEIGLDAASLLACGVVTGVGAVVHTAAVEAGSTVGVIGTGGVGLNAVQAAALTGAQLVLAVDVIESKLAAAREFGATHAVSAADGTVPDAVSELTGGRGLDYVFVTAGSAKAIEDAMPLLATAGTLVLVGMPPNATVAVDPEAVAERSLRILGSKVGSTRPQLDIPRLVELYRQGRLKLDELITHRVPLERINDGLAAAEHGEAIRAVVVVDE
jgi:S-(hydroxymethyl)glutathione dehydrogenase / alcohol dehydrogenase